MARRGLDLKGVSLLQANEVDLQIKHVSLFLPAKDEASLRIDGSKVRTYIIITVYKQTHTQQCLYSPQHWRYLPLLPYSDYSLGVQIESDVQIWKSLTEW